MWKIEDDAFYWSPEQETKEKAVVRNWVANKSWECTAWVEEDSISEKSWTCFQADPIEAMFGCLSMMPPDNDLTKTFKNIFETPLPISFWTWDVENNEYINSTSKWNLKIVLNNSLDKKWQAQLLGSCGTQIKTKYCTTPEDAIRFLLKISSSWIEDEVYYLLRMKLPPIQ